MESHRFSFSPASQTSAPPPLTGSPSSSGLLQGTTSNRVISLRGRNVVVHDIPVTSEESYKMLYSYLYMLEQLNPGTKTSVELDERSKFKYLFVALGACIEGFAVMRKVIIVDATRLKNKYGGVLVFAIAQDPNGHVYPLVFSVLDRESDDSWTWFFENLKSVIPDSSELVFMSIRNRIMISAIANVFPQAHHGHCLWHLKEKVKWHASGVEKDRVGQIFMELGRCYTVADFNSAYDSFKISYPSAYKYVEEHLEKDRWARVFFPRDRYNLDTSNSMESMKNMFKEATTWALIPMLDCIIGKFSVWFNQRRKDAFAGSINSKVVPRVENYLHELWPVAQRLPVRKIDSHEYEYEIRDTDGNKFLVSLVERSCTCKVWDYEKFPSLHGLAAYICYTRNFGSRIHIHELCSEYFWSELCALAYYKSLYVVPDRSFWNVPDYIKEVTIMPPYRIAWGGGGRRR